MRYRVHRIKESPREAFRWAAHSGGLATLKTKDYESDTEVEASSPYAAWKLLSNKNASLRPGDLLESLDQSGPTLQIAKYIGFEPAQWFVPEAKQESIPGPDPESNASKIAALQNNPV